MTKSFTFAVACLTIAIGGVLHAGTIGTRTGITNDANSGISESKTYTHLLDFIGDGSAATINTKAFTAAGTSGANWSSSGFGDTVPEALGGTTGADVGSGLEKLLKDFYYRGGLAGGDMSLTIDGLTAGVTYEARVYLRNWGGGSGRDIKFIFDEDDTGAISQDTTIDIDGTPAPSYLPYLYTAVSDGASGAHPLVIDFEQVNSRNASFHAYGFSNEVVPEPSTFAFALAAVGLLGLRRRRRA